MTEELVCDTLREWAAAQSTPFYIGSQYKYSEIMDNGSEYNLLHRNQMNIGVAEDVCKSQTTFPSAGSFNIGKCAELLELSNDNDQMFRYHALIWHYQQPQWLLDLDGTDTYENLYDTFDVHMYNYIEGVLTNVTAESGVDDIYAIDVVNEAITWSNDSNSWTWRTQPTDEGAWYSRMEDYIEKAFTYARQFAPNSKLFYNDFMMERYPAK